MVRVYISEVMRKIIYQANPSTDRGKDFKGDILYGSSENAPPVVNFMINQTPQNEKDTTSPRGMLIAQVEILELPGSK